MANCIPTPQASLISIPLAHSIGADTANEWTNRDDHATGSLAAWRAKSYAGFVTDIQAQDDFLTVLQAWETGFDHAIFAADATLARPKRDAIDISPAALSSAIDAVDLSTLGLEALDELWIILRAIWKLATHDEIMLGLARIGVARAHEWHELIRIQHERAAEHLAVLRGAHNHV